MTIFATVIVKEKLSKTFFCQSKLQRKLWASELNKEEEAYAEIMDDHPFSMDTVPSFKAFI